MKHRDFKHLAWLGLVGGLILTSEESGNAAQSSPYMSSQKDKFTAARDKKAAATSKDDFNPNDSNIGYHLYTEDELLLELNDEGLKMYNSLTPEAKQLTLKVASMRCAQTNECANLNACATDKNDCAGKGSCKGQGKCALSDKNLAVRLVYEKMASKRANALK